MWAKSRWSSRGMWYRVGEDCRHVVQYRAPEPPNGLPCLSGAPEVGAQVLVVEGAWNGKPACNSEVLSVRQGTLVIHQGRTWPGLQPRRDEGVCWSAVSNYAVHTEVVVGRACGAGGSRWEIGPERGVMAVAKPRLQAEKPLVPGDSTKLQAFSRDGVETVMGV